jgi:hypothetical protein
MAFIVPQLSRDVENYRNHRDFTRSYCKCVMFSVTFMHVSPRLKSNEKLKSAAYHIQYPGIDTRHYQ